MEEEWCPSQAVCVTGGIFPREGPPLSLLYRVLKEKVKQWLKTDVFPGTKLGPADDEPVLVPFQKGAARRGAVICLCFQHWSSGRLMLPNLVIYVQSFSLGEWGLLSSRELPYKQGTAMHTVWDLQSLCSDCGHIKVENIWTKDQSPGEFLAGSQSFLLPWAAFRLSSRHTSQPEGWPCASPSTLGSSGSPCEIQVTSFVREVRGQWLNVPRKQKTCCRMGDKEKVNILCP